MRNMKKEISGITFNRLKLNSSYCHYYVGDAKDYLIWEIPNAVRIAELSNIKYYGYVYKLDSRSFLLVVVEAEKRKSSGEVEVVIEKKDEILCKITIPKDSYIEFGDGEDIGAIVEKFIKNHNWSIAFY